MWLKAFCLCLLPITCFSGEIKIHLIDQVQVLAPKVTLGEIATIEGPKEVIDQLKEVFIALAPDVGRKGAISSYRIKSILESKGIDNADVYGMQSTFTTEKRSIPKEKLKTMVTEWIQGELPYGTDANLTFMGLTKDWSVPKGEGVDIKFMLQGGRISESTMVLMEALVDGKVMSSKRVRFNISLYRDVVTFIKPVQRGDQILRDYVELKRSDVTRLKGMEIASVDDVVGMVITRSAPSGMVLTLNDIEKPILVERGALSRIIIKNGSISMTITGAEAMKNGREGDLITFINPMNPRTTLQARIMGKDLAQIIIQ